MRRMPTFSSDSTISRVRPGAGRLWFGLLLLAGAWGCSPGARGAPLGAEETTGLAAPQRRWRADAGRGVEVPPIRVGDSLLVATTDRRLALYDLASGRRVWRKRIGGSLSGPPQLLHGRLVVTTAAPDGSVYLYDLKRRKPIWRRVLGDPAGGARLFENIVLAPTRDGRVNGLSPVDGRTVWVTNLETRISGDATLVPELALLVVPGRNGELAAVDARGGEKRWVTALEEPLIGAVADSAQVVAAGLGGSFYAVGTRTGRGEWQVATRAPLAAPPVLSAGLVLCATLDGQLYAWHRADGKPAWHQRLGGPFRSGPALAQDRGLLVGVSGLVWYFQLIDGALLGAVRHPETVLAGPVPGLAGEWVVSGEQGILEAYRWSSE